MARQWTLFLKLRRLLRSGSTTAHTLPPLPPLPPDGPPRSINFSRRNATQPAPPSPLRTYMLAVSKQRTCVQGEMGGWLAIRDGGLAY